MTCVLINYHRTKRSIVESYKTLSVNPTLGNYRLQQTMHVSRDDDARLPNSMFNVLVLITHLLV